MRTQNKKGFTLIEISIVLIIIGLIVGGVLVGRDLIKAAQFRSLITQTTEFDSAATTFRLKYNCIPGDCATGTNFFPTVANGNGNSLVEPSALSGLTYEHFQYWKTLGLSGLIAGEYTGLPIGGGPPQFYKMQFRAGINVPGTKFSKVHMGFLNTGMGFYNIGFDAAAFYILSDPFLSGEEAFAFDQKFDDGIPSTGKIRGERGMSQVDGCYVDANSYDLTQPVSKGCALHIYSNR